MTFLKRNRDELITIAQNYLNKEYGEFEIDENYFGVHGFVEKGEERLTNPCFWLAKTGVKTFMPNCSKEALMPVILGKILEGSTIRNDLMESVRLIWNRYDTTVRANLHRAKDTI